MKILDRIGLTLFSIIILLVSLTICITICGWLDIDVIQDALKYVLTNTIPARVTIIISVILGILAIKCIFFNSFTKDADRTKAGILLENENGKLLVSKDTIENLANSVINNFPSAENVTTRVDADATNNLSIFVTLSVYSDAVIKDLTTKIQKDVKETIKNSIDLDIKEVNVKIKNITPRKEETEKE